jgi:hypothetical protein
VSNGSEAVRLERTFQADIDPPELLVMTCEVIVDGAAFNGIHGGLTTECL